MANIEDNVAVRAKNIKKDFYLPHDRNNSLKSTVINIFRKRDKGADTQHALRGVSFEVNKGEFFGIVGRNGSGKSTLLKILAQIYQPTHGKVDINGKLVPFIELGVGFNPELTGRENVYLNGALLNFSKDEIEERYDEIVEFAELHDFMGQKLKNYSSGMQVRLAFSVATILARSDILLLDEVLAVGDANFQRKCFEYFKKLKKEKKTVVFVSHDMGAVREYCDKAILIEDGVVTFSGSSVAVAKEYTRLFLPDVYEEERRAKPKKGGTKWGGGGADIREFEVGKAIYSRDDRTIEFEYKVFADDNYDGSDVELGFSLKDETGKEVCGTNTRINQYSKKVYLHNDKATVARWKIDNIFGDGKYTLEAAVASNGQLLQWWGDATSFRVVNEYTTPYIVTPKMSISVEQEK